MWEGGTKGKELIGSLFDFPVVRLQELNGNLHHGAEELDEFKRRCPCCVFVIFVLFAFAFLFFATFAIFGRSVSVSF